MAKPSTKVAIYGAAGESGGLIINGLLESEDAQFDVTALARESGDKPGYQALATRGVKIVTINLNNAVEVIVKSLESIDVVIAAVPPHVLEAQIPLARAAKLAGVKRFVPSSYAMALAPGGAATVQNSREKVLAEVKSLDLPYTVIEVGWWHFGFIPKLPSGRTDWAIALPDFIVNMIPGDGNMKTCLVDNLDVGRLVAKIIVDDRTLNQKVMANGDVLTFNEVYDMAEELTGEKPEIKYWSAEQLDATIKQLQAATQDGKADYVTLVGRFWLEYYYSSFIDGDNSPEGVERLGFIWAKDLYPEFKPTAFKQFFQDILDKKRTLPYAGRS
ncbi:Semialdhyde-dh domain-containing protein [Fusarium sp. LHS14.1]|nr:Semialdhyde-dh domain-containing protein [Fusarium sp. LHS14.1]